MIIEGAIMKKLIEITPKEWIEFKQDYPKYYDVLDYAVVKEFEATLLIDFTRVNYVLNGGQVDQNVLK